jgi:PKHD-type hydroxylase
MNLNPHMVQAYTPEQVAEIAKLADSNIFTGAHDKPAQGVMKTADVKFLHWANLKHLMDWSQQWVRFFNSREIGLDIYDMQDLDLINYNIYSSSQQGEYQWHTDGTRGPADIKVTAVINISTEPYEGGDLELFVNGPRVVEEMRKPGMMVVFPSIVQHRVTPVTRGVRRTISYWVLGPNFR